MARKSKNAARHNNSEEASNSEAAGSAAVLEDATSGDADNRLGLMQAELVEKDELVAALTERLEQAAEQLDRIRRTGADRGGRSGGGGGLPPEFVDEQRQFIAEFQETFGEWNPTASDAALDRIDDRVARILEMLASGVSVVGTNANVDAAPSGESDGDGLSAYERMKANLLGDDAPSEPPPAPSAESDAASDATIHTEPETEPEPQVEPVEPPAPLEYGSVGKEELWAAVEVRDEYIGYLIRRLRRAETSKRPRGDWKQLEAVPDDLRARLLDLEKQLDATLRKAEIESSVERARQARESARLAELAEHLERRQQRLVDTPEADSTDADSGEPEKSGGWLKRRKLFGR